MNRKLVLMLTLTLLIGTLTVAFNVQSIKASGTIYIRADGSVDPADARISTVDNVTYILNDNITSDASGIVIERNDTIVDGAGCELQGPGYWGSTGIRLSGISNVTIRNMKITAFGDGISLAGASDNTFSRNKIANNMFGIRLSGCEHNNITGNNITENSWHGIFLSGSSRNVISENIFVNDGLTVSYESYGNLVEDNIVNGKPLVFLEGKSDLNVRDAGQVLLVNCSGIRVENLNLSSTDIGVELRGTHNSAVIGNNLSGNAGKDSEGGGVVLFDSSNNSIIQNNVTYNVQGINLLESSNNNLSGNCINVNSDFGIHCERGADNMIVGNNVTQNRFGIYVIDSDNNTIAGNNISDNSYAGIALPYGSNNSIYHNNFVNNARQVYDDSLSTNIWDDGASGGNYWSDYTGVDGDGNDIGDTPYDIDYNNRDHYPLMNPWTPIEHELVVSIVAPTSITLGASSSLNATVSNWGLDDEVAVELLVLINSTTVKSATVPLLQVSKSYTCTYVWTPAVDGIHNITAYVHPVLGETHAENNQETKFVSVSGFHELEVTSEVPAVLVLGASSSINATVSNHGTYREQNVAFLIFVNSTIVSSATIPFLEAGSSHTIYYTWVPEVEGKFNVTAYAHPVPGETSTENNQKTEFVTVSAPPQVGVKVGDWIKIDYTISGWPSGTPYPEWLKIEFLTIEGTNATTRVTMHMSDGTEPSQTMTIDVVGGGGAFQGLSGFVIPPNCTTDDSVCMSGYGNVIVAGETTRSYAGASRTVVYASFSQYGTQLTYYWDKQTGVMVEAQTVSGGVSGTAEATETNMWQTAPSGLPIEPIYLYILTALAIVIVIGAAAFIIRRKKKPPEEAENSQSELRLTRTGFKRNFGHRTTHVQSEW